MRPPPRKKEFPLAKVYTLIEPGPVLLLTTARGGRGNIMTLAWHTMIEFEPPLVGCVVSDRNYSFGTLRATGECVLNIPAAGLAKKAVACGNTTGERVDKFKKFGLTPVAASRVNAPMVGECWANLECRVFDDALVEKYGFFILEVVRAWTDPKVKDPRTFHHRGKDLFYVSGKTLRLTNKMK